jgi:hypothetical protein
MTYGAPTMMPSIPPHMPDKLPQFLCRGCIGVDPVEFEVPEDLPCRHCGALVTIDDRLEHARNVMSALIRLGHGRMALHAMIEPSRSSELVPEHLKVFQEHPQT